eukprot:365312-Chlamydomonas_euryale.AAC.2
MGLRALEKREFVTGAGAPARLAPRQVGASPLLRALANDSAPAHTRSHALHRVAIAGGGGRCAGVSVDPADTAVAG